MDKVEASQNTQLLQFDWKRIVFLCVKRRKQKKLSLDDLSKISGVPKPIILHFEDGLTNYTLETFFKIIAPLDADRNSSPHLGFLDWESFVKKSIERREDLGLSIDKMGALAPVSYNVIKKFENGEKNIHLNSIIKILRALNISQSRCFQKKPVKKNHVIRKEKKYGTQNLPIVTEPLLNWEKIVGLCISTRHQLNLTQKDLAKKTGLSRATIVTFESGLTNLNMKTIFKIFDALNLNKNLDKANLALYFSILEWERFVKKAIERKDALCLSRNELAKFSNITFPAVTNFEKFSMNISLNTVIAILKILGLLSKN